MNLLGCWVLALVVFRIGFICGATENEPAVSSIVPDDEPRMQLRGAASNRTLQQALGQITKFSLINALTDTPIMDLSSGLVINLATLPTRSINIQAVTTGFIGSIRFAFAGNPRFEIDSRAPFSLCSEKSGDFMACANLTVVGDYVLTATPYSMSGANGTWGSMLRISLKIIDKTCKIPKVCLPY